TLFRSQIERDSPNFFTSYFLEQSNQDTTLEISRDPDVFELVLRYLNGYQVVPIHERLVPPTSTPETALSDLRADAEFYQLRGLLDLCIASEQRQVVELVVSYAMITGHLRVSEGGVSPTEDLKSIIPRFSISLLNEEIFDGETQGMWAVTDETVGKHGYLLVSSWSDHIVRTVLSKQPSVSLWQVMGWRGRMEGDIRHAAIFVKLHRLPGTFLR
ncbi:hypothetical protein BDV93DRAFT_524982, partial [Ceratobasidium sp. AG-I]